MSQRSIWITVKHSDPRLNLYSAQVLLQRGKKGKQQDALATF